MPLRCIFMLLLSYGIHYYYHQGQEYIYWGKEHLSRTCLFKERALLAQTNTQLCNNNIHLGVGDLPTQQTGSSREAQNPIAPWSVCLPPLSCRLLAAFCPNSVHFADFCGALRCTSESHVISTAAWHRAWWAPGCERTEVAQSIQTPRQ